MKKLQIVQNRATRFITGYSRAARIDSTTLHHLSFLDPVNSHLHILARNIWQNMEINNPEIYNNLPLQEDAIHFSQKRFPSSKKIALAPDTAPMFT